MLDFARWSRETAHVGDTPASLKAFQMADAAAAPQAAASEPAAALAGPLATAADLQLWIAALGGGHGVISVDADGTVSGGSQGYGLATYYANSIDNPATTGIAEGLYRPNDIVFDTVHGKFFIADSDINGGHNRVLQGNIADLLSGAPPALTILYQDSGTGTAARIDNLQIDPNNGLVYFTHGQRLEKVGYDSAGQVPTILANLGSGNPNGNTNNFIDDFVIDFAAGTIFLSSHRILSGIEGDTVTKNYIYRITGLTPSSGAGAFSFAGGQVTVLPFAPDDNDAMPNGTAAPGEAFPQEGGSLEGLAISPDGSTLYFATASTLFDHDGDSGFAGDGDPNTTDPQLVMGGIYSYALTGNAAGTYSLIYQQVPGSGPQGLLDDLEIDFATGHWYVADITGAQSGNSNPPGDEGIWRGSLAGGTPDFFAGVNNPGGLVPGGFVINRAPTLVAADAAAVAVEAAGSGSGASAPVQPLASIDADDVENADQTDQLAGAQVRISDGFQAVAGHQEALTINGTTSGTLDFGARDIAYSYNAATGVMTLSGASSFANYEAALALVSFSISGDNPTGYGAAPTRTLSYSVSDGLLCSDEQDAVVTVAPTNDAPVNIVGGDVSTSEDSAAVAVTGLAVSDVDADPGSDVISVTLSVGRGTLDVDAAVANGLGAGDISGNGTDTVVLTGTQNQINQTLSALDGVTYTPTADLNGADALTMTSDDDGHGGAGGALQDQDLVAIEVAAVNDAPTVAGDGTEEAAPIEEDAPSATGETVASLFGGQYSDAVDAVAGGSSADAFAGIAVVANGSGADGQWQYHDGANWVDIGPASAGAAVLLAAGTSVRFNPAAGFSGTAPTLIAHLVDASAGAIAAGALADLTVTGGTTRYSDDTVTLGQTVLHGNDPPTGVTGTLEIDEFPDNGTIVGTVVAEDSDSSSFTYVLVDDAGGRFDMSGDGVVTVEDGLLLDHEQQDSHTIRVQVTDDEGAVAEFDMEVAIADVHGETVTGDGRDNVMYGGIETDTFRGGHGADTIRGQGGDDFIFGGTGLIDPLDDGDMLYGGGGSDFIDGNGGDDVIAGGAESDSVVGGYGNDTIYGGGSAHDAAETGADLLLGNVGDDLIYGGGGGDWLLGGDGIDRLDGGAGSDLLTGGAGHDVFVFRKGEANGDIIGDYAGHGGQAGDSIRLEGYAPGTTFTRVGGSNLWQINDHGDIETVVIVATGSVHHSDVIFG
ncbi:MAG TPA: hypothetical protein VGW34_13445 [Allosphingosinicella sp.]|nr:hypothetical protein [Allosphingosinicella sp.]